MSDNVVATFFQDESLLSVSMGQDGLLGYFASNYSNIIAMYGAIDEQEEETCDKKRQAYEELEDLRNDLVHLDDQISTHGVLQPAEQGQYTKTKLAIEANEKLLEEEDIIFFRGEPLRMCADYEFIQKVEGRFPGIMLAMLEIDNMLRRPISSWVGKALGTASLPLKVIASFIIRTTNLGVAGNLLYMLIDQYPCIIQNRMAPEVPTGRPVDYPEYKLKDYSIKEEKHEVVIKQPYQEK